MEQNVSTLDTLANTRTSNPGLFRLSMTSLVILAILLLLGGRGLAQRNQLQQMQARQAAQAEALSAAEANFGIKVVRLSPAAAGYMLDLRYRVLDPVKAKPLLDQKVRPHLLIGEHTRLEVPQTPTVGTLKQSTMTPKAGQTYFAMIANPGKRVQPGDDVTLVMGDFAAPVVVTR